MSDMDWTAHWDDSGYTPSLDMLQTHDLDALRTYFSEAEPGMRLRLPQGFDEQRAKANALRGQR